MSTLESVGLFITLSLGGLGMFLVILSVTFVFAKMVTKSAEFERFEEEETMVEHEEYDDYVDFPLQDRRDIYLIEETVEEGENTRTGTTKYGRQDGSTKRNFLSTLWNGFLSRGLKENIIGEKFIELKP